MERGKGIEPSALAWKARVLPLYEPRINFGATGQNRTGTPLWNQILSLTCLPISPQSHDTLIIYYFIKNVNYFGAPGEIRTHTPFEHWFLKPAWLPLHHRGINH